jgi:Flp pilus assembly protein TadG
MNPAIASRLKESESGAVAIEFAIVGGILIAAMVGVIEFGQILHVRNELSQAADRGAREMLVCPGVSKPDLKAVVTAAFSGAAADLVVTDVDKTVQGLNFREISVTYPVTISMPGLHHSFTVSATRRAPKSSECPRNI